jgi:hypothetical protein
MSKRRFSLGLNIASAVIVVCILAVPLMAQESEEKAPAPKNSLRDGAWALQFGLPALSRGGYDDPEVSIKYLLSDRRAVRLGIEVDGLISFGKSDDYRGQTVPDSLADFEEFDSDRQGIRIEAEYTSYGFNESDLHFFWGVGPLFEYSRQFEKSVRVSYYYDGLRRNVTESEIHQWALGLSGSIGAEWFLLERVSILAEYGISFQYDYYTREMNAVSSFDDFRSKNKYHRNSFDLDLRESRIALSVYL